MAVACRWLFHPGTKNEINTEDSILVLEDIDASPIRSMHDDPPQNRPENSRAFEALSSVKC